MWTFSFQHFCLTSAFLKWNIMTEASLNLPVPPQHSHPLLPAWLMAAAISHRGDCREMENLLQTKAPRLTLSTLPPRGCSTSLGLTLPTLMQLPVDLREWKISTGSVCILLIFLCFLKTVCKSEQSRILLWCWNTCGTPINIKAVIASLNSVLSHVKSV